MERRVKNDEPINVDTTSGDNKHPWCEKTLDFKYTAHQLRHTNITTLCASGLDIKKLQYLAGHKDIKKPLNIYAHVVNNTHTPDELAPLLAGVF